MKIWPVEVVDTWLTYDAPHTGHVQKQPYVVYPNDAKWCAYRDHVAHLNRHCYPHNEQFLHEALADSTFPHLDKLLDDLDIYIMSYPSVYHCNAAADGKAMVFYGRGTHRSLGR